MALRVISMILLREGQYTFTINDGKQRRNCLRSIKFKNISSVYVHMHKADLINYNLFHESFNDLPINLWYFSIRLRKLNFCRFTVINYYNLY